MNNLTNWSNLRRYILDRAKHNRAHKFTQVSAAVRYKAESKLRIWVDELIHEQPSKGKTIR